VIPAGLADRLRAVAREMPGGLAVFDADGTLWRDDVGEAFLRHLISLGWVTLPDGGDPYQEYERRVDQDKQSGYAFAAQLQAGLEVQRIGAEADRFARDWVPPRLVSDSQALRALCLEAGLVPAAVSASPLPIVVAAAPLAGISRERCCGIEVEARRGRFTELLVGPLTYARGKVEAASRFGRIALGCGDSFTGDLALLESARIAIAVAPAAGSPLSAEAQRRGWPVLSQEG